MEQDRPLTIFYAAISAFWLSLPLSLTIPLPAKYIVSLYVIGGFFLLSNLGMAIMYRNDIRTNPKLLGSLLMLAYGPVEHLRHLKGIAMVSLQESPTDQQTTSI